MHTEYKQHVVIHGGEEPYGCTMDCDEKNYMLTCVNYVEQDSYFMCMCVTHYHKGYLAMNEI